MLKLKLGQTAPTQSAVLARVTDNSVGSDDMILLEDLSRDIPSNNVPSVGYSHVVEAGALSLSTDLLMATNPVLFKYVKHNENRRIPIPLPYRWNVGTNTEFGRERWYLVDEAVDEVWDPADKDPAKQVLENNLLIVDQDGAVADVNFQIEDIIDNGTVNGFQTYDVTILLDRQSSPDRYYRLKYNAVGSSDVRVRHSVTEAINSTAMISYDIYTDSGNYSHNGGKYEIVARYDNHIYLVGDSSPLETMPMLRLVPKDGKSYTFEVHITGGDRYLRINDGTDNYDFLATGVSTREMVDSINNALIGIQAIFLVDYPDCNYFDGSITSVSTAGTYVLFSIDAVGVYYPEHASVYVTKPRTGVSNIDPWYLRIRNGGFGIDNVSKVTYSTVEVDNQHGAGRFGGYNWDSVKEELDSPAPYQLQLANTNFYPAYTRVYKNDQDVTPEIVDYDKTSGVLYFNRKVQDGTYYADYTYNDPYWIPYRHLNLNPRGIHNPEARTKYYVIYAAGTDIEHTATVTTTYDRCIYHTESENLQEAINSVSLFDSQGYSRWPVILAVVQVSHNRELSEVTVLDVRTRGGGLSKPHKDEDESRFYIDHGHIDGEPFSANGPVAVEVPEEVKTARDLTIDNPGDQYYNGYELPGNDNADSIKKVAKRYLAAGTYPLVKFNE